MKKKTKKLLLSRETITALRQVKVGGAAAYTGPSCDSIEPWWSCTCEPWGD